jgi:hypothetical protein
VLVTTSHNACRLNCMSGHFWPPFPTKVHAAAGAAANQRPGSSKRLYRPWRASPRIDGDES